MVPLRDDWAIENDLHWVLDVAFREDDSRVRFEDAAECFAVIGHMALNLLRNARFKSWYQKPAIRGRMQR